MADLPNDNPPELKQVSVDSDSDATVIYSGFYVSNNNTNQSSVVITSEDKKHDIPPMGSDTDDDDGNHDSEDEVHASDLDVADVIARRLPDAVSADDKKRLEVVHKRGAEKEILGMSRTAFRLPTMFDCRKRARLRDENMKDGLLRLLMRLHMACDTEMAFCLNRHNQIIDEAEREKSLEVLKLLRQSSKDVQSLRDLVSKVIACDTNVRTRDTPLRLNLQRNVMFKMQLLMANPCFMEHSILLHICNIMFCGASTDRDLSPRRLQT